MVFSERDSPCGLDRGVQHGWIHKPGTLMGAVGNLGLDGPSSPHGLGPLMCFSNRMDFLHGSSRLQVFQMEASSPMKG